MATELVGYSVTVCAPVDPEGMYEYRQVAVSRDAPDFIEAILPNVVEVLTIEMGHKVPDRSTWTWWAEPMRSLR